MDFARSTPSKFEWRDWLNSAARSRGLVYFGAVVPDYPQDSIRFLKWLSEGKQADLAYLEKYLEIRKAPTQLMPDAKTVLVFGLPYFDGDSWPKHGEAFSGIPRVAQYARFRDYHKVFVPALTELCDQMRSELGVSHSARVVVDTAPVLERALAANSASGFIGKNTCFIDPKQGSFFLLGEIFTSLSLSPDEKEQGDPTVRTEHGGCGRCNRCQVKCPTGALQTDYSIDARLCLAYWTIEHRGPIPEKFWPFLRYYWFGCDICQLVCPYNAASSIPRRPDHLVARSLPDLFQTATMTPTQYESFFGGTPLTRAKRNGLRRNALIAMTVLRDRRLDDALRCAERDCDSPIDQTLEQIRVYRLRQAKEGVFD